MENRGPTNGNKPQQIVHFVSDKQFVVVQITENLMLLPNEDFKEAVGAGATASQLKLDELSVSLGPLGTVDGVLLQDPTRPRFSVERSVVVDFRKKETLLPPDRVFMSSQPLDTCQYMMARVCEQKAMPLNLNSLSLAAVQKRRETFSTAQALRKTALDSKKQAKLDKLKLELQSGDSKVASDVDGDDEGEGEEEEGSEEEEEAVEEVEEAFKTFLPDTVSGHQKANALFPS